jgi:hypothetical protein
MIPNELEGIPANLPATDDYSIVIITGKSVRSQHFGLRVIEEFGDLVTCWYECDRSVSPEFAEGFGPGGKSVKELLREAYKDSVRYKRVGGRLGQFRALFRALKFRYFWRKYLDKNAAAEKKMFCDEVKRLRSEIGREPRKVHPNDVNTPEFIEHLKDQNPYFLLTLGGPLYSEKILNVPRGAPINQHAGHSPDLRGSNTVHWALYHHQLQYISNTVHITTTGADSGPILRRSNPCLMPTDDPATIVCRVVAVGTALMIEVVRDIIAGKDVKIFPQPIGVGETYLGRDVRAHMLDSLKHDISVGWLRDELVRLRDW